MSRVRPVTPDERQQIIEALLAGESQNSIAKRLGRSQTTIYRIAKAEGIDSVNPPPKKANEARVKYARAGRIRVIEKGIDYAEKLIDAGEIGGRELYNWSMALAVLLDKRRQEDDESAQRRGSISLLMERLREEERGDDDAGSSDG